MIKFSWGTKIAILYIGFVALIGVMVFMSMQQKVELVSDDYYEKELAYQSKLDDMNNANALSEKMSHFFAGNSLVVQLPNEFKTSPTKGQILFFKPSDSSKDLKFNLQLDSEAKQQIELNTLSKGMYKMQVSVKANNTSYFFEEIIVIP